MPIKSNLHARNRAASAGDAGDVPRRLRFQLGFPLCKAIQIANVAVRDRDLLLLAALPRRRQVLPNDVRDLVLVPDVLAAFLG